MSTISFFLDNIAFISKYAAAHFSLIFTAVIISLLLWLPVGVLISRNEKLANAVLGIANTLYCIPSLALFSFLVTIPAFGLGRKSALLALVIYAMMPLVRNVYQGIKIVDKNVIEAARGMGMNPWRILREIQLPLAAPVIFAGFRITVVMTTGVAAIAAFIGEKNLGRLITVGMNGYNVDMIVTGALLISLIAILLDTILGFFERLIIPRGLRAHRS